jgi:thiamine biosynthesis lipoprotein
MNLRACFLAAAPFLFAVHLVAGETVSRTQVMMGTFATIELPEAYASEIERGFAILKAVEGSLSSYDENADIYRLNRDRKTKITPYTYKAMHDCRRYYEESRGFFDITVGSITKKLYRFGEAERSVPVTALGCARIDFGGVHFDSNEAFLDENVTVDLGGMGKGFGVDRVAEFFRSKGIEEGKIALSGDIRCLGRCKIAVQDPFSEGIMADFQTKAPDTAVSTSGNYRRYVGGKSYSHLIDPKRKRSQRIFASITLVGNQSNGDLDAYATAASVMPLVEAAAFLQRMGVGYLLVLTDGTKVESQNLSLFASNLRYR